MEVGICGENILKLWEVTEARSLWMGFLSWGESTKRGHVLCLAPRVLPAIWHWCSSAQSGCGYAEIGGVVFWCGSWSQKPLLLLGYQQWSCREPQTLPCLQKKTPRLSQKSFDPLFAFALDTVSPPRNYVPPWSAFLLGRNSQQLWKLRLPWPSDQLPGMQHWKYTTSLVGTPTCPCPGQQQGQGHFKNLPWRVPCESYLFSPLRCGNKIHSSIYFSQWQSPGVFRNSLPMLQLTFSGYVPSSSDSPETVTHGL